MDTFYPYIVLESEGSVPDKNMPGFVNPDLPKRVGIKKLSSAIKVGGHM